MAAIIALLEFLHLRGREGVWGDVSLYSHVGLWTVVQASFRGFYKSKPPSQCKCANGISPVFIESLLKCSSEFPWQ